MLVNNADAWPGTPSCRTPPTAWAGAWRPLAAGPRPAFAVNGRATALLIAEFAAASARGATWGRIVGLTSGGPSGFPEEVSYGAGKDALESYTCRPPRSSAAYGVTANVVYPPATDTGWVTPAVEQAATAASPLRHLAHPDDVAEVISSWPPTRPATSPARSSTWPEHHPTVVADTCQNSTTGYRHCVHQRGQAQPQGQRSQPAGNRQWLFGRHPPDQAVVGAYRWAYSMAGWVLPTPPSPWTVLACTTAPLCRVRSRPRRLVRSSLRPVKFGVRAGPRRFGSRPG